MIRFICLLSIQIAFFPDVNGHGYLKTPRSRNWVAAEDGTWNGGPAYTGIPQTESCPHCLNIKEADALCGVGNAGTTYDSFNDINGDPMPWTSQAVYEEGDEITVEAFLSTNHAGHMEMWLCPDGDGSTQECLWSNPATMIRDELYGGPADPNYPERAYFGTGTDFRFTYKLPDGLTGDQVLVQWRYITANSCIPPGYRPGNPVGNSLLELGWLRNLGMVDCVPPYSPDGSRAPGSPEQFWNCAEITIIPSGPTPPTISPAPSSCIDSSLDLNVDGETLTCDWISLESTCLCAIPGVSAHCPNACSSCA